MKLKPSVLRERSSQMQRQLIITAMMVGLVAITSSDVRGAGKNAAEEAAIRKQIAAYDMGTRGLGLPEQVFWSGAYKRPIVGNEKGEPAEGGNSIPNRVPGSQKNKTEVIRIVVADSGDLAYEYSKSTLEFDLKSGEHQSAMTGLLRVWQKQNGDWRIAAFFARAYDTDFVPQ
jgi:hypothetical protein